MDRKNDDSRLLLEQVNDLLENNKILELRELLEEYHTMDILDVMENLDEEMKVKLFEVLPIDVSASILEESGSEFFRTMLSLIDVQHGRNILEQMSLDDLTDILSELEEDERQRIINLLNKEDAEDVRKLLGYEEESTGGIMTTGYIEVNENMTAKEAIEHMRKNAEDAETIYYIYVVDNDEKLVGVLSLRELITARDSVVVADLMSENIISVYDDDDRELAVKLVSKYDLIAIPVVDRENILRGIITVDDIIDVMEEEATEDLYKLAGSSEHERDVAEKPDSTMLEQIVSSVRARIPWLLLILIGGLFTAIILTKTTFVEGLTYVKFLCFVPVILGMGGSVGMQSSSLTIMTLSNNDEEDIDFRTVLKEGAVGLITGLVCSIIIGAMAYLILQSLNMSIVIGICVLINMVVGAMIGSFTPLMLKHLSGDIAIISSPLISVLLDMIGVVLFFIITTIFLSKIVS